MCRRGKQWRCSEGGYCCVIDESVELPKKVSGQYLFALGKVSRLLTRRSSKGEAILPRIAQKLQRSLSEDLVSSEQDAAFFSVSRKDRRLCRRW